MSTHHATTGAGQPPLIQRTLRAAVLALLLALLLLPAGCQRRAGPASPPPLPPRAPSGRLQEVAPPAAVQQLARALAEREPRVAIQAPADGATLASTPWTLQLRVNDWPLVDGGPLGLGPHIAVQIDDQPVVRLTDHRSTPAGAFVEVTLPALSPGSHRITAYAARPWGEAVKSPGASARLRVQSVAANPLALPAPGSPELVPVSPTNASTSEPVLLDWLLDNAPLQHLREGDGSWRLRVSVNGDSFLVDQNVPLWLRGWKNGSNALQLELVDGRGEPLNPPYNSLVREVTLAGGAPPRWLQGPLSEEELAVLLGEAPSAAPEPLSPPSGSTPANDVAGDSNAGDSNAADDDAGNHTPANRLISAEASPSEPMEVPAGAAASPDMAAPVEPEPASQSEPEPAEADPPSDLLSDLPSDLPSDPPSDQTSNLAPDPPAAPVISNPDRIAPSSSLSGSARDQVAADGTLIQPSPRGPLGGLRQRLGAS